MPSLLQRGRGHKNIYVWGNIFVSHLIYITLFLKVTVFKVNCYSIFDNKPHHPKLQCFPHCCLLSCHLPYFHSIEYGINRKLIWNDKNITTLTKYICISCSLYNNLKIVCIITFMQFSFIKKKSINTLSKKHFIRENCHFFFKMSMCHFTLTNSYLSKSLCISSISCRLSAEK